MPATIEDVDNFLRDSAWTKGEKWVIKWQFRILGDFHTALANAIKRADENNLAKLEKGFPEEVQAFRSWNQGDLAQRLRKAGLNI